MCDLIANSVLDFEDATVVSLSRKPLSSSLYFFENGDNLISVSNNRPLSRSKNLISAQGGKSNKYGIPSACYIRLFSKKTKSVLKGKFINKHARKPHDPGKRPLIFHETVHL